MAHLTTTLTHNSDRTWTLSLHGIIDASTHDMMWSLESSALLLQQLIETQAKMLFVDLTHAERIDSHGLRLLLNAQKEFTNENVQIILKNPNSHLNRLFQIMQFDRVFTIEFDS